MDYIVATSGRTGSNVLQRLMRNNGFGEPNEYFHKDFGFGEAVEQGASTGDWLKKSRELHTRNDIFGVKLMFSTLYPMAQSMRPPSKDRRDVLLGFFPDARYIFLYRQDTYRQAVSLWRAVTSGEWIRRPGEEPPAWDGVALDPEAIRAHLDYINNSNRWWCSFFEREGISPLVVSYEQLIESPRRVFFEIVELLGQPFSHEPVLDVDIVRQADEITDRYVAQLEELLGSERPCVWIPAGARGRSPCPDAR